MHYQKTDISTHVLRMEDDARHALSTNRRTNFNPRPPHGGRLQRPNCFGMPQYFNPRPPHGGRRSDMHLQQHIYPFQPTSSAWRTTLYLLRKGFDLIFQPTSSAWRTTAHFPTLPARSKISTHVLRMEDDRKNGVQVLYAKISTHVLRMEDDLL